MVLLASSYSKKCGNYITEIHESYFLWEIKCVITMLQITELMTKRTVVVYSVVREKEPGAY